jgi:hypothetical protein
VAPPQAGGRAPWEGVQRDAVPQGRRPGGSGAGDSLEGRLALEWPDTTVDVPGDPHTERGLHQAAWGHRPTATYE